MACLPDLITAAYFQLQVLIDLLRNVWDLLIGYWLHNKLETISGVCYLSIQLPCSMDVSIESISNIP